MVIAASASAQAIVVLGGGVVGDCTPNLNSLWRTLHGARLFKAGRAPLIVTTGGGAGGACPVAEAMAQTARDLGVPADRLIVETESRSTWENGERTARVLHGRGITHVLLVTDRLHMRRAVGVFARAGFAVEPVSVPIYEGHPDNVSMLYAGLREMVALVYYRLVHGAIPAVTAAHESAMSSTAADAIAADPPAVPDLIVFGASYAGSWPLDRLDGEVVANRGVPGQRTADFLERFERDVLAVKPRAVLIWGFINDLFAASDARTASAEVQRAYADMIARARDRGIEESELAIAHDLLFQGCADPRADRIGVAGRHGLEAGVDQLGVQRHRDPLLAERHTLILLGHRTGDPWLRCPRVVPARIRGFPWRSTT